MTIQPKIGVKVGAATKTVSTYTHRSPVRYIGKQTHRGHQAWILVPKHDDVPFERFSCGHFHQKARAARECGVVIAKRIGKQIGMEVVS
jgi:hypothetical protein